MLPSHCERYFLDGRRERAALPPPGVAEVVVAVAGVALGAEPDAEIAGRVVAAGEAATEWVGRRVVVPRVLPCGDCDACRRGRTATCSSRAPRAGLATHETVPARYLCSVEPPLWPPSLTDDELWQLAALADAASAPYGALVRAGLAPGELLVVIGGGARGAFAVALARAKGAQPILIDPAPSRGERALSFGARFIVDGNSPAAETRAEIERQAGALGIPLHGYKILESSGTAAGRQRALALLPDGGTVVFLDGGDDLPLSVPVPAPSWESLVRAEGQLLGAAACHPDLLPELCALVVRGELPLDRLTRRISLDELDATLQARRAGQLDALPILTP